MITPENIKVHELIGLQASIIECVNRQIIGLRGKVVNETKHLLVLDTERGLKKIPKGIAIWKFFFNNKDATVDGNLLLKRPHERLGEKQ